jgi:hypothetical protein
MKDEPVRRYVGLKATRIGEARSELLSFIARDLACAVHRSAAANCRVDPAADF